LSRAVLLGELGGMSRQYAILGAVKKAFLVASNVGSNIRQDRESRKGRIIVDCPLTGGNPPVINLQAGGNACSGKHTECRSE
jgi:hypothetical protein